MDNKECQKLIDDNIVTAMDEYAQYLYTNNITNTLNFISNKELAKILVHNYLHIKFYNDQEFIDFIKYFNEYISKNQNKIRTVITCLSLLKTTWTEE